MRTLPRAGLAGLGLAALALLVGGSGASALRFDDVSVAEGLVFHRAGDPDDRDTAFVELMGGGACWLDHDRDGDLDVFAVSGWYNNTSLAASKAPRSQLFRNLGAGLGFDDATGAAALGVRGWTQACSAADYDGDGWTDLAVVGYGIQSLYRNQGDGTFANVTAASGIAAQGKCPGEPCWGSGAAWGDYDRDGCLDLVVINFVRYNLTLGGLRGPGYYEGQPSQLYRNSCQGTFADVTEAAGADGNPGPSHGKNWGVAWLDYDRNGWPDLYIASDGTPNILLRNQGNGTFVDLAQEAGVADPRNGMGLAVNDCNDDGLEDLYFTHYTAPETVAYFGYDGFYTNDGDGTFTDHSGEGDLAVAIDFIKWGVGWEDFDNDGLLDLHVATGGTEPPAVDPRANEKPLFWLGNGTAGACTYRDARGEAGPALDLARMGRGSSYADYDYDGVLDWVQVNLVEEPSQLVRGSGAAGNWLALELRQPGPNPEALLAEVEATLPDGRVLHRRMNPGQSIHGNNAPQIHLGFGEAWSVNVTVRWPADLATTTFTGLAANQLLRLFADGSVQNDTLAPRTVARVDGQPLPASAWWTEPVVVEVAAEDRGVSWASGVASTTVTLDGAPAGASVPIAEGRHVLRVASTDAAGNVEAAATYVVGLDLEPPSVSAAFDAPFADLWYRAPVVVTLACADAVSGVADLAWRLDGGAWQAYEGPFTVALAGTHQVAWACADDAGHRVEDAATLRIDVGHPTTQASFAGLEGDAGWWRSAVTVSLASEGGLQQVARVEAALDGGPWEAYEGPFTIASEGRHQLAFRAVDDAGREEPTRLAEVPIDATAPALAVHPVAPFVWAEDGTLVVGAVNRVAVTASDGLAGLAWVRAAADDQPPQPGEAGVAFVGEGAHALHGRARDAAGNEGTLLVPVWVDLTPPELAVTKPAQASVVVGDVAAPLPVWVLTARAVVAGDAPIEADASDAVAGMARVGFRVDGALVALDEAAPWVWRWSLPPDPGRLERVVELRASDRVGNARVLAFRVVAVGDLPDAPGLAAAPALPLLALLAAGGAAGGTWARRWR